MSSGPIFSGFLAIFGNFEAREKPFEFSHESGQKEIEKKRFFPVATDFFCDFFYPLSWENSKDFPLASKLPKIAKKPEKTGPEDTNGAD